MKKIKEMEENIDNKVDVNVFDNEIASIRELLGNLEADNAASKGLKI